MTFTGNHPFQEGEQAAWAVQSTDCPSSGWGTLSSGMQLTVTLLVGNYELCLKQAGSAIAVKHSHITATALHLPPSPPPSPLLPPGGCTSSVGLNFRSFAVEDDGTCVVGGCTDSTNAAYDPSATFNDGRCIVIFPGALCMHLSQHPNVSPTMRLDPSMISHLNPSP